MQAAHLHPVSWPLPQEPAYPAGAAMAAVSGGGGSGGEPGVDQRAGQRTRIRSREASLGGSRARRRTAAANPISVVNLFAVASNNLGWAPEAAPNSARAAQAVVHVRGRKAHAANGPQAAEGRS